MDEASGHLPEVVGEAAGSDRIVYLTDHGRRVAAIVPADQAWFWTPGWQAAIAESEAEIRDGRGRTFDSAEDIFDEFDAVRGETDA
jgi:antitoxin (DNA-binding transcriptional repressor) of toxin-antitoxin stability system